MIGITVGDCKYVPVSLVAGMTGIPAMALKEAVDNGTIESITFMRHRWIPEDVAKTLKSRYLGGCCFLPDIQITTEAADNV